MPRPVARSASVVRPAISGWGVIAKSGCLGWRSNPAVRTIHRTRRRRFGWSGCTWPAAGVNAEGRKSCAPGCKASTRAPAFLRRARWDGSLHQHGWSRSPLWRRRGPDRAWPALRRARRPNEVWTVDFKGCFHTADGRRCDPLTVRDAYSRYGLCIRVLHGHKLATVQCEFVRLFRRFGLPRRIHADQGRP